MPGKLLKFNNRLKEAEQSLERVKYTTRRVSDDSALSWTIEFCLGLWNILFSFQAQTALLIPNLYVPSSFKNFLTEKKTKKSSASSKLHFLYKWRPFTEIIYDLRKAQSSYQSIIFRYMFRLFISVDFQNIHFQHDGLLCLL